MPTAGYEPKLPAQHALYRVVLEHLETFLAEAERARDGERLPRFVEEEFRGFLTCGVLAGGFARFRCGGCGLDRLVPFSCKGRGFCPSCGGRRMAERAAHLVDHVFPPVGVRQWVLSFPHRLRYLLAWDHALCRAVVAVYVRALLAFHRGRAAQRGVVNGRGGAVVFVQRFGAALNLNVHFHALVLDGVFAENAGGGVAFRALPPPRDDDVAAVLAVVRRRVLMLLRRRGLLDASDESGGADGLAEEAPVLAGISAASVVGSIAREGPEDVSVSTGARECAARRRKESGSQAPRDPSRSLWADLMRRTFDFDVLGCPRCGGRMRLVATIEQRSVIDRILRHLGLPADLPAPWPARAPPLRPDPFDASAYPPVDETGTSA